MEKVDLSIIILNYKMAGLTKNCLKSIFSHDYASSIEVIVIDNNSNDNCQQMIDQYFDQVIYIQNPQNHGWAKGNNIGIARAKGRYILILNPDIVFLEPVFDEWLAYMDEYQTIGICTLQLKNPDGSIQSGAWRFHRFATPLFQRLPFFQRFSTVKQHLRHFNFSEWDRKQSKDVHWVQGSCLLMRKRAFDDIGPIDQSFFLYFTDVDWCRMAWKCGWRVHYYANLSAIHYYRRASADAVGLKSLFHKSTRIHIKDWFTYVLKYRKNLYEDPLG